MGRVLLSVIEDSSGAHDVLAGGSTAASNAARYDGATRNTRDNLVLAALKLGLVAPRPAARALASSRRSASTTTAGSSGAPRLRAATTLSTCGPRWTCWSRSPTARTRWTPRRASRRHRSTVTRYRAPPAAPDDLCRTATAEALRGFDEHRQPSCLRCGSPWPSSADRGMNPHARSPPDRPRTFDDPPNAPLHDHPSPPTPRAPASSGRARPSASSTATASRPSTRCSTTPHDHAERYSAQDTIRAQGAAYVGTGTRLMSNEGNVMLDRRRRHLRPARHLRGRLLLREQHRALRPRDALPARLPRELPARCLEARHDASATSCPTSTSS